MQGLVVEGLEAFVSLRLRHGTSVVELDVLIDTGFTGCLTLPREVVSELGLELEGETLAVLADGSEVTYDMYFCTVDWFDGNRSVEVLATDSTPLLGMELLAGMRLQRDVVPDGVVSISPYAA